MVRSLVNAAFEGKPKTGTVFPKFSGDECDEIYDFDSLLEPHYSQSIFFRRITRAASLVFL
jgi:hypothetical protein